VGARAQRHDTGGAGLSVDRDEPQRTAPKRTEPNRTEPNGTSTRAGNNPPVTMAASPPHRRPWRELGAAELERAYSPSSCIGGNYQPFIDAYASRSVAARVEAATLGGAWHSLAYGAAAAQRLELCVPAARPGPAAGAGLLVFIHGGYWQELSAAQSLFPAAQCVAHGLAFAAIDYTLAPAASVGDIVAECRAALAWLLAHAAGLGIDAGRVVVAGSSAGAHLAAMVCLGPSGASGSNPAAASAQDHTGPRASIAGARPRAAVLVSGLYDLEPLVGTSINDALSLTPAAARAQSPMQHLLQGFPTALLAWGAIETDAFKDQSRDFAAALARAQTTCTTLEVAARNHFDVILDLADDRTELGRQTLALFA
jgi:arylformamidase